MASGIFTLLTTALKQAFSKNTNLNIFILLYNFDKCSKKLKNLIYNEFTHILSADQPAIRPGCASSNFYSTKVVMFDLRNCCSDHRLSTPPWC